MIDLVSKIPLNYLRSGIKALDIAFLIPELEIDSNHINHPSFMIFLYIIVWYKTIGERQQMRFISSKHFVFIGTFVLLEPTGVSVNTTKAVHMDSTCSSSSSVRYSSTCHAMSSNESLRRYEMAGTSHEWLSSSGSTVGKLFLLPVESSSTNETSSKSSGILPAGFR